MRCSCLRLRGKTMTVTGLLDHVSLLYIRCIDFDLLIGDVVAILVLLVLVIEGVR